MAALFDRLDVYFGCPFGPHWYGNGPKCPMHFQRETLRTQVTDFL